MVRGWASKPVTDRNRDSRIFVGTVKNPIAIIKRGEIAGYLTSDFMDYFECWRIANAGYGLPYGQGWAQYPKVFMDMLVMFADEWKGMTHGSI